MVTPNLLEDGEVYRLQEEKTAYEQFTKHERMKTGETIIQSLIRQHAGRRIFVIGFSAGATIAWKCDSMPEVSGAVCYYGSRIRDSLDHVPVCPVLLFSLHMSRRLMLRFSSKTAGKTAARFGDLSI